MIPSFKPTLPQMGFMFRNLKLYFCFFVAAAIISLSTPRNMLLQYLPSMYTAWSRGRVPAFSAVPRS